jgi:hypothetical protein
MVANFNVINIKSFRIKIKNSNKNMNSKLDKNENEEVQEYFQSFI